MDPTVTERIAHYRITRKLGEGGMGVVFAAHDERLDRAVAIKKIRTGVADASARERLWREARSAAAVNHPNVCQLYEIGEADGELFLAMELLEGESLADRIARGPLAVAEASQVVLAILDALAPLHQRGILHRDLKPSNVFMTPYGVKLLDFGLAGSIAGLKEDTQLTHSGMVMGTPHYVAPEALAGGDVDGRSDLFAVGALFYEMLSGRQAFTGRDPMQVFHAVLHEEPPPIGGSAAVTAVDRVLRRALAKRPERRYANAEGMASDLRSALLLADTTGSMVQAQQLRRLIVLPFRMLRPDLDTEFLAFSLPDAISNSLSSLDSIVVRSSMAAAHLKAEELDLDALSKVDVDIVLTGTLLRAGDQIRVSNQLVDAHNGAVLWSQSSQRSLGDIFQLQDALTRKIVESLSVPLSAHDESALRRDVPADPKAYEYYLRANQLAISSSSWNGARELYLKCLELDPGFAPAWARLGRIYRVIAQYGGERSDENYELAQQAFRRALEINHDLPIAHHLYTNVEVDLGRAQEAMVRLLRRVAEHPTDAELFAGLVQSCRYCGLLDASIAAYEHAVRLDPAIRTSVNHAYLMRGDWQRSVETNVEDPPLMSVMALDLGGRQEQGIEMLLEAERRNLPKVMRSFVESLRLILQGRKEEAQVTLAEMDPLPFRDPCARFYFARMLAAAGMVQPSLAMLERSVEGGFSCFSFMTRDPRLESIRGTDQFRALLRRAEARERQARAAFIEAGGDRVLNLEI